MELALAVARALAIDADRGGGRPVADTIGDGALRANVHHGVVL